MSADSMPMYESLADQIKYFLLNGASYDVAPDLGADVLDQVDAFLARFISYPDEHARHAHVLWIAHCWLTDCFGHTPRLVFISPEPGCGKTHALTVTGCLVPRPEHVANLSAAGLYYSIDEALERKGGRPTILYDELDSVFGNAEVGRIRNEEIRSLINAGHGPRSETLVRKIGKETKRFQLYSPVALAGKMDLSYVPATIRERSVVIHMQRPLPNEKIERWNRYGSPAEAESLSWLLRYWIELVHGYALDYVGPDRPVLPEGIENRDADVWEPLLTVADLAGRHWPERARVAAVTAVTASKANVPSEGMRLLWEIHAIFERLKVGHISSRELVAELDETGEFAWSRLPAQRAGIRMANTLKGYGVGPSSFRDGTKTLKGYQWGAFVDAWLRYPPPSGDNGDIGDNGDNGGDDDE